MRSAPSSFAPYTEASWLMLTEPSRPPREASNLGWPGRKSNFFCS